MPTETLISIIDDDEDFREAIARLMKSRGFTVEAFPSALAFLSCPNIRNTSCLIVDAHMPRMTGIELHRRLLESGYAIPTIQSGYLDDSVRARALADGIICYLTKPCDEDALDASRRLWSGPSQMNIVHDDHSHVGALTEGGNHDVMVRKGSVPNHRGATDSERRWVSDRAVP